MDPKLAILFVLIGGVLVLANVNRETFVHLRRTVAAWRLRILPENGRRV